MIVLGIETSCDDTSCALLKDKEVLSSIVSSQLVHAKYGGVVPELAARAHIKNIVHVYTIALKEAGLTQSQINGVAVTYGPGLIGSLFIGLEFAKSLAYALGVPFIGINHLEAHIFSVFIENDITPPLLILLVSGGHTELIIMHDYGRYELLGSTLDDACGEAFDKVGALLGLPYPGGPKIEKLAKKGDPKTIPFPVANPPNYDFSFSGLKTQVMYCLKGLGKWKPYAKTKREDIAASFQHAAIEALFIKAKLAISQTHIKKLALVGGVVANQYLIERFKELDVELYYPSKKYCTDNAAMVALCGSYYLKQGKKSPFNLKPVPNLEI